MKYQAIVAGFLLIVLLAGCVLIPEKSPWEGQMTGTDAGNVDCSAGTILLDTAGAAYTMNTSVTNTAVAVCFNVTAGNVSLDCGGFTITGGRINSSDQNTTNALAAIYSNRLNTTIKNCVIHNWQNGIYLTSSSGNINNNSIANIYGYQGITSVSYGDEKGFPGGLASGVYLSSISNTITINQNTISNIIGGTGGTSVPVGQDSGVIGGLGARAVGIFQANVNNSISYSNTISNLTGGTGGAGGPYKDGSRGGSASGVYVSESNNITIYSNTINNLTTSVGGSPGAYAVAGNPGISFGMYFPTYQNIILYNVSPGTGMNLLNGKPIIYLYNKSNIEFKNYDLTSSDNPTNLGKIAIYMGNNISINNNNLSFYQSEHGVPCDRPNCASTTFGYPAYGITLINATNSYIYSNSIKNITGGNCGTGGVSVLCGSAYGVYLVTNNTTVYSNIISNLTGGARHEACSEDIGGYGIGTYLSGVNSTIYLNTFRNLTNSPSGTCGGPPASYSASISIASTNSNKNSIYLNDFNTTTTYSIIDLNGSNFYNATYDGKNQGNIYANVMNRSIVVQGENLSSISGLYIGTSGAVPYNNSTSGGKFSCNFVGCGDYAPLTNWNANEPVINSSTILPSPAYNTAPLQLWCNATTADAANVTYNYTVYMNGAVNTTGTYPFSSMCYQESANTTNQSSTDGSCGLNYTGTYLATGWLNKAALYDGDWATRTRANMDPCYLYVNYSKPSLGQSAKWNLKYENDTAITAENLTIPTSCFSQSKLQLYILNIYTVGYNISCYNGTGWESISQKSDTTMTKYFYEEAMWWNISNSVTQGINTNVANISQASLVAGQNWTLQCSAYNSNGTSAFLNSSVTTIQSSVTNACTYSGSGNWIINLADNCNITTSANLGANWLIYNGTGTVSYNNSSSTIVISAKGETLTNIVGSFYEKILSTIWKNYTG